MVQNIIDVRNLSKSFDISSKEPGLKGTIKHFFKRQTKSLKVIKDISFEIKEGEIVGFLGANGAGKTTILKMLCGLIYPSEGSILVSGYLPFRRKENFLKNITLIMGQKQQLIWDLPPAHRWPHGVRHSPVYTNNYLKHGTGIPPAAHWRLHHWLFLSVQSLEFLQRFLHLR